MRPPQAGQPSRAGQVAAGVVVAVLAALVMALVVGLLSWAVVAVWARVLT